MNIFVLDIDPGRAAMLHTDKHVVKMVTESVQMLSTALHQNGQDGPYRKTHVNHPCTKWVSESYSNWVWLRELATHLGAEYTHRYGKVHKAAIVASHLPDIDIADIGRTKFALAMPDQYKCDDPVRAYRDYYLGEKRHLFSFKNRSISLQDFE